MVHSDTVDAIMSGDEQVPLAHGEPAAAAAGFFASRTRKVVVAAAAALAVTVAVLSKARQASGGGGLLGERATELESFPPYGTIGCSNWKEISGPRSQVADKAACAKQCSDDPKCQSFNWQQNACEPGWPVPRGCLLFYGECKTERNNCWELNYKIPFPPAPAPATPACPSPEINVEGYGNVRVINSIDTGSTVETGANKLVTNMNSRSYFAASGSPCDEDYKPKPDYLALNLLGKTWSYTVDISASKCGCNSAMYLTAMAQNDQPGNCKGDWYCDANAVCGVNCAEIDIQEANEKSWHSTLHTKNDGAGSPAGGIGGSVGLPVAWAGKFEPGSTCIDTTKPFEVKASFPVDGNGELTQLSTTLVQGDCKLETTTAYTDAASQKEVSDALKAGMTPVISYWKSTTDGVWNPDGMSWLDQPPCPAGGDGQTCGEQILYTNFKVAPIA